MPDVQTEIADKVRGVAAEKRKDQESIATILGLSRQAVNQRFTGRVPWTAPELQTLAEKLDVDVVRFYPARVTAAGVR